MPVAKRLGLVSAAPPGGQSVRKGRRLFILPRPFRAPRRENVQKTDPIGNEAAAQAPKSHANSITTPIRRQQVAHNQEYVMRMAVIEFYGRANRRPAARQPGHDPEVAEFARNSVFSPAVVATRLNSLRAFSSEAAAVPAQGASSANANLDLLSRHRGRSREPKGLVGQPTNGRSARQLSRSGHLLRHRRRGPSPIGPCLPAFDSPTVSSRIAQSLARKSQENGRLVRLLQSRN